jgi:hypothetical protein
MQQLILGIGTAIWRVIEPYSQKGRCLKVKDGIIKETKFLGTL